MKSAPFAASADFGRCSWACLNMAFVRMVAQRPRALSSFLLLSLRVHDSWLLRLKNAFLLGSGGASLCCSYGCLPPLVPALSIIYFGKITPLLMVTDTSHHLFLPRLNGDYGTAAGPKARSNASAACGLYLGSAFATLYTAALLIGALEVDLST